MDNFSFDTHLDTSTIVDFTTDKIKNFFDQNRDDIVNFYKSWIISLSAPYLEDINSRHIPDHFNISLAEVTTPTDKQFVLILFVENSEKFVIPKDFEEINLSGKNNFHIDINSRKVFFSVVNDKLLFGCHIATLGEDGFEPSSLINTGGFNCDSCHSAIDIGGSLCEVCNFDMCENCSKMVNHDHPTFEYRGFYPVAFVNIDNVLINLRYDIKNQCFV